MGMNKVSSAYAKHRKQSHWDVTANFPIVPTFQLMHNLNNQFFFFFNSKRRVVARIGCWQSLSQSHCVMMAPLWSSKLFITDGRMERTKNVINSNNRKGISYV